MAKCAALGVFLLLLVGATAGQPPQAGQLPNEVKLPDGTVGKRVPAQPNDICRACYQEVGKDDPVYEVKGQRIALHAEEMQKDFLLQLGSLVTQLEPRGALFDNRDGSQLSNAWLYFGLYVLVGLVFGALCAHRALHTGHSPLAWFGWGLLLNVVGYAALRMRPRREGATLEAVPRGLGKVAATYAPAVCKACGAENHPSARQCIGCGAHLTPRFVSEAERARQGAS